MLNGNGKLSSVSTTNVCRRDGHFLLRSNTLEKMSYTQGFLYLIIIIIIIYNIYRAPIPNGPKNLTPGSKLVVPRSISASPNLK